MIENLKQAMQMWALKKDFNKEPVPEVWEYYKKWREDNSGMAYLREIQEYILKQGSIPEELWSHLYTEIYLCSQKWSDEQDEKYREDMKKKGFYLLTEITEYRGAILLSAKQQIDSLSKSIERECKLIELPDKRLFVLPKGNRTRGWYVSSLEDAFYKPLNK